MNLDRLSRFLQWKVAAAVVGVHAILLFPPAHAGESFLLTAGRDALSLCQPALLLGWAFLGPGRWWWRLPAATVLLVIATWVWGNFAAWSEWDRSGWLYLAFYLSFTAALGALALAGQKLYRTTSGHDHPAQFSIRNLLIATTLVAAMLAALEYLRPTLAASDLQRVLTFEVLRGEILLPDDGLTATTVRAIVLGVLNAVVALASIAVVLRPGAPWLRLLGLAVGIPSLSVYLIHLIGVGDDSFAQRAAELAVAFAALGGMTAISVLPLRLFGLRLCRSVSLRTKRHIPQCEAPFANQSNEPSLQAAAAAVMSEPIS